MAAAAAIAVTVNDDDDDVCANCHQSSAAIKCGGCGSAHYCSQKCQATHWSTHHYDECAGGGGDGILMHIGAKTRQQPTRTVSKKPRSTEGPSVPTTRRARAAALNQGVVKKKPTDTSQRTDYEGAESEEDMDIDGDEEDDDDDDDDTLSRASSESKIVEFRAIDRVPVEAERIHFCAGTTLACSTKINNDTDQRLAIEGVEGMKIREFINLLINDYQVMLGRFKDALRIAFQEMWIIYKDALRSIENEIRDVKIRYENATGNRWNDKDIKDRGLFDTEMEGLSRAETRLVDILIEVRDQRSYFDSYNSRVMPKIGDIVRQRGIIRSNMEQEQPTSSFTRAPLPRADTTDKTQQSPERPSIEEDTFNPKIRILRTDIDDGNASDGSWVSSRIGAKKGDSSTSSSSSMSSDDDAIPFVRRPRRKASKADREIKEFALKAQKQNALIAEMSARDSVQWSFLSEYTTDLEAGKTDLKGPRNDRWVNQWILSNSGGGTKWGLSDTISYTQDDLRDIIGELFDEGFSKKRREASAKRSLQKLSGPAVGDDDDDDDDFSVDQDDDDSDGDGGSGGSGMRAEQTLAQKKELIKNLKRPQTQEDREEKLAERAINLITTLLKIDELIGLANIKTNIVKLIIRFISNPKRILGDRATGRARSFLGIAYLGPPGTGKTTIAKDVGNVMIALGLITPPPGDQDSFRVLLSSDLIAGYGGQTPLKVRNIILSLIGSSFLIDEVYDLGAGDDESGGGSSMGQEAISALTALFDQYKGLMLPQIAGYKELVEKQVYAKNRGFKRRFPNQWQIFTFTPKELINIFRDRIKSRPGAVNPLFSITFRDPRKDKRADSDPLALLEEDSTAEHLRVRKYAENFITEARDQGYFVDSNGAGINTYISAIEDVAEVRYTRDPRFTRTKRGRLGVVLEDVIAAIEEFVKASGDPRSKEEVAKFDERESDLVFYVSQ